MITISKLETLKNVAEIAKEEGRSSDLSGIVMLEAAAIYSVGSLGEAIEAWAVATGNKRLLSEIEMQASKSALLKLMAKRLYPDSRGEALSFYSGYLHYEQTSLWHENAAELDAYEQGRKANPLTARFEAATEQARSEMIAKFNGNPSGDDPLSYGEKLHHFYEKRVQQIMSQYE